MRRDASARDGARDGEAFLQQRGQRGETVGAVERLGVSAFVEDDAEGGGGGEGHGKQGMGGWRLASRVRPSR